jgi:hypothetical protein
MWPCHLIYLKSILKGKRRRVMETQIISPYKNIKFPKNPLKEAKIIQDIILLYNYKSQEFQHKPKYIIFLKILIE